MKLIVLGFCIVLTAFAGYVGVTEYGIPWYWPAIAVGSLGWFPAGVGVARLSYLADYHFFEPGKTPSYSAGGIAAIMFFWPVVIVLLFIVAICVTIGRYSEPVFEWVGSYVRRP